MKKLTFGLFLSFFCATGFSSAVYAQTAPWEPYNRVIAVVNNKPVIESDFNNRVEQLAKMKGKEAANRNKVLDLLINEMILEQTAEAESIQVTEERLDSEVKKIMERSGIKDPDIFKKKIESEQHADIETIRNDIRRQIITEQVMMVAVDFNPPTKKEAKDWYDKNKQQLVQIKMKHILIRPKGSGFAAEKEANEKLKDVQRRLLAGETFEDLARKLSEDPESAVKGGDLGYATLAELDPYFANQVMQQFNPGKVSSIIKSSYGYHLVKFYDRRTAPFEEMEARISNFISGQSRMEQFEKWLIRVRKESEIKIYLEGYTPPQG